jgi:membrane protease YdiL (CAAX protease family)
MKEKVPFTSGLERNEALLVLLWRPMHIWLLPMLLQALAPGLDTGSINLLYFAISVLFLALVSRRFLRRDFDPLCDRPGRVLGEVVLSYLILMGCNLIAGVLLYFLLPETSNPNNAAISMAVTEQNYPKMRAAIVLLAPIAEELLFRAGVFGVMRHRSRVAAYVVSVLLFGLLHVWQYVAVDPRYWVYLLQYIAPGILLARVYERCNTIWASMALHAVINFNALNAMMVLQEMEEMLRAQGML